MADYEELAELGFEAIDRGVDRYHDKVYDHLPAWKKKQQKQEAQDRRRSQEQQQHNKAPPANEHQRSRDAEAGEPYEDEYDNDRDMSYAQSQAPPYGRQDHRDYRDDRDARFAQNEGATSAYYRNAAPGAIMMRDNEAYQGQPGYGGVPNAQPPPAYGYGYGYDDQRDRGRPAPSRTRSTSWSPPRNPRDEDDKPRRRRQSRSRSRSKEGLKDNKERLAATLIGGLVGGFAGNQFRKGQKYDTVATVAGAVLGGLASREIAEKIGSKQEERRERRQGEQEAWEQKHGDGGRDDSRRRDRDSGDYSRDSRRYR